MWPRFQFIAATAPPPDRDANSRSYIRFEVDAILVPAAQCACMVACMASVCTTIAVIWALLALAGMMVANMITLPRDLKNLKPRDDIPPL